MPLTASSPCALLFSPDSPQQHHERQSKASRTLSVPVGSTSAAAAAVAASVSFAAGTPQHTAGKISYAAAVAGSAAADETPLGGAAAAAAAGAAEAVQRAGSVLIATERESAESALLHAVRYPLSFLLFFLRTLCAAGKGRL